MKNFKENIRRSFKKVKEDIEEIKSNQREIIELLKKNKTEPIKEIEQLEISITPVQKLILKALMDRNDIWLSYTDIGELTARDPNTIKQQMFKLRKNISIDSQKFIDRKVRFKLSPKTEKRISIQL